MPETPPHEIQGLADQALDNLVHQFARPLDFLRELVQNSIDAGTPRVEVWTRFEPPTDGAAQGVLEVHVDDFGEGMDEALIDTQLTRMFSSTKEGDLTKIGKFGIGFTSIFAIEPDAVLLRTGRHGEAWELLFHPDRSFDKVRADSALTGTKITLFKRMAAEEVAPFVRESRWVLSYWCEHSDTPVLFGDRSGAADPATEVASPGTDDPFADFAAAPTPDSGGLEPVTRPMGLDAELIVELEEEGVQVVVGLAAAPSYGFYNGGLTLLSTHNSDALGESAEELSHLAFKVKYDHLEHTLTRDNVLQDAHFHKAMGVLQLAARRLRKELLQRSAEAIEGGDDPTRWYGWLATECRINELHRSYSGFDQAVRLVDRRGESLSLAQVERQERRHDAVLLDPGEGPLASALEEAGNHLLRDTAAVRELLDACYKPPLLWFLDQGRTVVPADALYLVPGTLEPDQLSPQERVLTVDCEEMLQASLGDRLRVRVGSFGGGSAARELPLVLDSPDDGGVCRRDDDISLSWPLIRRRTLVINRHHAAYEAHLAASAADPELGAFGLAQAVLHMAGVRGKRRFGKLMSEAIRRHLDQVGEGDGWGELL